MTRRASFQAVGRGHAADAVFDQLAASILREELLAGTALPPERVLSETFAVSPLVVRQAIHRLAEAGLVRVRQGGATLVQDVTASTDIRLIGLYYQLHPEGAAAKRIKRDAVEKQFLQGLALVDVCGRRASAEDKQAIVALTNTADPTTEHELAAFEEAFWRALAKSGGNRIYQMEVTWWYDTLGDARPEVASAASLSDRMAFYRELARRLATGEGASAYYLAVVSPQLDALFHVPS